MHKIPELWPWFIDWIWMKKPLSSEIVSHRESCYRTMVIHSNLFSCFREAYLFFKSIETIALVGSECWPPFSAFFFFYNVKNSHKTIIFSLFSCKIYFRSFFPVHESSYLLGNSCVSLLSDFSSPCLFYSIIGYLEFIGRMFEAFWVSRESCSSSPLRCAIIESEELSLRPMYDKRIIADISSWERSFFYKLYLHITLPCEKAQYAVESAWFADMEIRFTQN